MQVTAWHSGSGQYGIRVGMANRDEWFIKSWPHIDVEIDGKSHRFALTNGFWNKCPEFRDNASTTIRDWLKTRRLLNWPKGSPPRMTLEPLGGSKFRLIAAQQNA